MKIKRTWTERSLRAGQSEVIEEAKAREIISLTTLGSHHAGKCGNEGCLHCPEPAMKRLLAGEKLQQFFCDLELIEA